MPTVKRYKDKPGLYVRATQGRTIATYQVKEVGCQRLEQLGFGKGGKISWDLFYSLKNDDLLHTGGSGPGEIDSDLESLEEPIDLNQQSNAAAGYVCLIVAAIAVYAGYWCVWNFMALTSAFAVWVASWPSRSWWSIGCAVYLTVPSVIVGIARRSIVAGLGLLGVLTLTIAVPATIYFTVVWILSWKPATWMVLILAVVIFAAISSIIVALSHWKNGEKDG